MKNRKVGSAHIIHELRRESAQGAQDQGLVAAERVTLC
jgi:hypothetical protein